MKEGRRPQVVSLPLCSCVLGQGILQFFLGIPKGVILILAIGQPNLCSVVYTHGFRIALIAISRTIFASIRFAILIAPRVQCPVKPAPTYRAHCISAHFNSSCKIFRVCIHFTLILPLFGFLTAAHKYYGFSGTVMLSEAPSLGSASALRYTHLIVYVFPTLFPMLST